MNKDLLVKISMLLFFISTFLMGQDSLQNDVSWPYLAKSPWPMIKHDPQFTGRANVKGPQTNRIIWTLDTDMGVAMGPVMGYDNILYFGTNYNLAPNTFWAINSDGNVNWSYNPSDYMKSENNIICSSDGIIYLQSMEGSIYAFYGADSIKWKYEGGEIFPSGTLMNMDYNGNLVFTTDSGYLISISKDKILNWKVRYENGFAGQSPAMSPDGEMIYVCGKDSNLFAINPYNGAIKWNFNCGKIDNLLLVDDEGNIYFRPRGKPSTFYSLNPNGLIRWSSILRYTKSSQCYSSPTIDKSGNIYTVFFDTLTLRRQIISFDYSGKLKWSFTFIDSNDVNYLDDFTQPLICDSEGTVYVGSTFGKYYYAISSDGKLKWKLDLEGMQADYTGCLGPDGTLYIAVHNSSLVRNQVKNIIAIKDSNTTNVEMLGGLPEKFNLSQNYPNPFNPSTIIEFELSEYSHTQLKVYDVLGREVGILINEQKPAGKYRVEFNISEYELASGVYFYQLNTEKFNQIKKMVILR